MAYLLEAPVLSVFYFATVHAFKVGYEGMRFSDGGKVVFIVFGVGLMTNRYHHRIIITASTICQSKAILML
jgi:hypothetical protein